MPIQILPAILANQIAAGEVVERPASVIKELIENSLDAGATQIEIEIDKGGHKRILVRDNGKGIDKSELTLALSRHATSKISALDDLEGIISLGFRGEALASISSVARLTLTSRTQEQSEAWQAHAEGRDMEVQVNPAAHPKGTSVEVLDLFFNTPARRKFLRTEKTEFNHIEEVIKRIALSRFDVSFSLKHNGKLVRKYPLAGNDNARFKRITSVCGNEFSRHAHQVTSKYQQLTLTGWLAGPSGARTQNDVQYFYVNGRMMRDKLINHAIRQAFEGLLPAEHYPAFALYLEIPPDQVDVNVHPAKHEVRFHQSRLVHDFIYRAVTDVLEQGYQATALDESGSEVVSGFDGVRELGDVAPKHDYITPLSRGYETQGMPASSGGGASIGVARSSGHRNHPVSSQAAQNYQTLMQPSMGPDNATLPATTIDHVVVDWMNVDGDVALVKLEQDFFALPLSEIYKQKLIREFEQSPPVSQPLLMPVSMEAEPRHFQAAQSLQEALLTLNVEISFTGKRILLKKVPAGFRQLPWTNMLGDILNAPDTGEETVLNHLCGVITSHTERADDNVANRLVNWIPNTWPDTWQEKVAAWGRSLPLAEWIKRNASDR